MLTSLLILFMLPFALIGLFIFVKIALPKKPPADTSNRINHLRLVWFAVNRPEIFAVWFEWLKHDEYDNVNND